MLSNFKIIKTYKYNKLDEHDTMLLCLCVQVFFMDLDEARKEFILPAINFILVKEF